jgi:hypothetical protein
MLPLTQAASDQSVTRQHVGGAVHSAPGATLASGASRMLMYSRFGGAGALAGGAQAASPQVGADARRGMSDVPVAVIPDPEPRARSRPDASR